MKKHISGKKLSRSTNERKQLFRSLTRSLVEKGSIETTLSKAQAARRIIEKLVTTAKGGTLSDLRLVAKRTGDGLVAQKLMTIAKAMISRPGGYIRMVKLGVRAGDAAQIVKLEWVEKVVVAETVSEPKVTPQKQVKKDKSTKPKSLPKKAAVKKKTKKTV